MIIPSESFTLLKRLLTWSAKLSSWRKRDKDASNNVSKRKDSPPKFAGNYKGPLYAPHPDIKK